jgi:hypothetical protein
MSMFFRCYGYFSFENEAEAKRNFEILKTRDDTWYLYCPEELSLEHQKIVFKTNGNFLAYRTCENTIDVISEIAENAESGVVKIDEGDNENVLWSWRTYSVLNRLVFRDHTKPQKSYQFKAKLEFADAQTTKMYCHMLMTDSTFIFTKFPPNQLVFTHDKRFITFDEQFLLIDAHCPGDAVLFRKTEAILQKIKSEGIGGNLEMGETIALRFIPNKSEDSTDWVNDMERNVYYRYTGKLTFETIEEAHIACQKLLNDERSLFKISAKNSFPIYIIGTKLIVDDIGSCHRTLLNNTYVLLQEIAATAKNGKVEAAFSNKATMDSYIVERTVPSKARKSIKDSAVIAKRKAK